MEKVNLMFSNREKRRELDRFVIFLSVILQGGTKNVEVFWSSVWPNKQMVLTLPARCSFEICARHKRLVVASASYCRSGRRWAAHLRR